MVVQVLTEEQSLRLKAQQLSEYAEGLLKMANDMAKKADFLARQTRLNDLTNNTTSSVSSDTFSGDWIH